MKSAILIFSVLLAGGAAAAEVTESDIVGRYLLASREQQFALRGVSMEVDIDADIPNLKKQGKLHALRNISKLGKITYHMLGFNGDTAVKKEVIARYLAAEVQSDTGPNISISPDNYKFKYKGLKWHDGVATYVLGISPRKKLVGLFKGELWLDQTTCMPVREAGRFVKSPSIFLGKMEFVRIYEMKNGIAIPQSLQSMVDTRLFGPVKLNINFTNFAKDPEPEAVALASTTETQNQN